MQASRCLKRVSDALPEKALISVRHLARHLSDTCQLNETKSLTCWCLTECLDVSDRCSIVTVCLRGVFLEPPRPDTQTVKQQFGGNK